MSDRIAILGGRGMLGSDLASVIETQGGAVRIYDLPEFDLTNPEHVQSALNDVDVVVNCAAYTNVDGAESDQDRAFQVNAEAVGQLARMAKDQGCYVLHISTDFVFDGQQAEPYVETDTPNPISVYGQSKLAGEQLFFANECEGAVVRVQWTYGNHGTNFVKKLLERAQSTGKLKVVDDQVGAPTATRDVARALVNVIEKRATGLYHCAASGYVSRYEMAQFVVDHLNLDILVESCKTCDFVCPADRPLNSRFNCDKLTSLLGTPMRAWQDSLIEYLEQL